MCGISGIAGEGSLEILHRMNDAITHRGPDAEGVWIDEAARVFLGHRRLSIIDIAGGQQPMWTEDGSLGIVFNGEIYNHLELRKELIALGYQFQTDHSDTESLLHAYRAWGSDFVNRLNGMWAFVIYDRSHRRLFCSRDRFGKKPFFYYLHRQTFVFASELSALREHPLTPSRLSTRSLKKYFGYGYIPAPNTMLENVFKLPAGHSLTFDLDTRTLRVQKYWDFVIEPFDAVPHNPESVWGERLRVLLDAAVKRRLISDVPLGTFLSGGVDSSAVTAFAVKHTGKDCLNTFSMGFEEEPFDESKKARNVAQLLGTVHYQERLSVDRARSLMPDIVAKLDEPMGDSSLLPTYLLCRFARKTVTVALGGDGADELFAGYDPFHALRLARLYQALVPRPLHQAIRLVAARLPVSHTKMSLDFRIKRALRGLGYTPSLWSPVWMATLEPDELQDLVGEPADIEDIYSEAIEQWDACKQPNVVDRTLQFYTKLYLQDDILVKVDRASMMNSLEVRAPFLDLDVVDFVRQLPHSYKYRNGQTKYLLKSALEPILPRELLHQKKQGFGIPIGKWLRESAFDVQFPSYVPVSASFSRAKLAAHRSGKSDERAFLWNYWVLAQVLGRQQALVPA